MECYSELKGILANATVCVYLEDLCAIWKCKYCMIYTYKVVEKSDPQEWK